MKSLVFKLPYPPSVNRIYAKNANGSYRPTAKAALFRSNAIAAIWAQLARDGLPCPRLKEPLYVQIELVPPVGKVVGDGDNYFKATVDALEHAKVVLNDKVIEDHRVIRLAPAGKGHCWVGVYPIASAPPRLTMVRADAHTAD